MNANDALALIEHMCDSNAEKLEDDAQANLVEVDSIRSILAQVQKRMQDATELVDPMGTTLATWRPTAAPRRLDTAALRADHPDLAAAYTRPGNPGRAFRLAKQKETPDA